MTVSKALTAAWEASSVEAGEGHGYYRRRIPLQLVLPVYAGVIVPGKVRCLSFDFEEAVLKGLNLRDHTCGYLVEADKQSGAERVFIHLQETAEAKPKDLFLILCADILDHILPCEAPAEVARTLHQRLRHWKMFFQNRSLEGLSRDEYIGLFAEIDFFEKCLQKGLPPQILADAWQGPLGTNQDFLFGSVAVEVKAVTANDAGSLRVTNIRQLDDTGLTGLFLSHVAYDFRQGAGRNMLSLIESVRALLHLAPDAGATFNNRLLAAGYLESDPSRFAGYGFTERQRAYYKVREGFPRILESGLSSGISEVCYSLNLAGCSGFAVSEADLMTALPR